MSTSANYQFTSEYFEKVKLTSVSQSILKTSHTPLEANTSSVSSSLWLAWISNGFPALQYCSNKVMGFEVVTNGCLLGETDGERDCSRNLNSYTLRKEQIAVRKSNKNNKNPSIQIHPFNVNKELEERGENDLQVIRLSSYKSSEITISETRNHSKKSLVNNLAWSSNSGLPWRKAEIHFQMTGNLNDTTEVLVGHLK